MLLRILLAWTAGLLPAVCALAPGPLQLAVLDVGQGDALLLRTPRGRSVLIDGGPDGRVLSGIGASLGAGDALDLVVVTHPHADHYAGLLPVLRSRRVRRIALSGAVTESQGVEDLLAHAHAERIPVTWVSAPQQFRLDGVVLDVLGPDRLHVGERPKHPNAASVVLRVSYGDARILLTGDLESAGERALVRRIPDLRASIYKAGHHGSKTSSTDALLRAVRPEWMPVSVGARNVYRHPSAEVLARAEALGTTPSRTDQRGTLRFTCSRTCCGPLPGWKQLLPAPFQGPSCGHPPARVP